MSYRLLVHKLIRPIAKRCGYSPTLCGDSLRAISHVERMTTGFRYDAMDDFEAGQVHAAVERLYERVHGMWRWRGCPGREKEGAE